MAKKKEEQYMINHEGKELKFKMSDLSAEAGQSYSRANELAAQLIRLEQQCNELRFLANNYLRTVVDELVVDEEEK